MITNNQSLGDFEIVEILHYDYVNSEIYFVSTENPEPDSELDPKLRNVFSMKIVESKITKNSRKLKRACHTCDAALRPCGKWTAQIFASPQDDRPYILRTCKGPSTPFVDLTFINSESVTSNLLVEGKVPLT